MCVLFPQIDFVIFQGKSCILNLFISTSKSSKMLCKKYKKILEQADVKVANT